MRRALNVGVIGLGRMGQVHLDALTRLRPMGVRVAALSDPQPLVAEAICAQYEVPHYHENPADLIERPDIDAVWIISPSEYHADQIKLCAANKKHIFCEKPVVTSLADVPSVRQALKLSGVQFMTAYNRRFDTSIMRFYNKLYSDSIGKLINLSIFSGDVCPPPIEYSRRCGGLFKDMSIHDLDMARWLIGSNPLTVQAWGYNNIDPNLALLKEEGFAEDHCIDTAVIMMTFMNDITVFIRNCRKSPFGHDQRIEALGVHGVINVHNQQTNTVQMWNEAGMTPVDALPNNMNRYLGSYLEESKQFCTHLLHETSLPPELPSFDDGVDSLLMAATCSEALRKRSALHFELHRQELLQIKA